MADAWFIFLYCQKDFLKIGGCVNVFVHVTERKICNYSLIYTLRKTDQTQINSLSPFIHTGFPWEEEDDVVMVEKRRRIRLQWKYSQTMWYAGLEASNPNRWGVVFWKHTLQLHLRAKLQKRELNKTQENKQPKNIPVSVFKSSFFARVDGKWIIKQRRKGALHTSTMCFLKHSYKDLIVR